MGDSDDEQEKRRSRDKFRRERDSDSHERDYFQNSERRDSRRSYRNDSSPLSGPNNRHHSSYHSNGPNSRHHSHQPNHEMMFDSRKRHSDISAINQNKKFRKNWVDFDNPMYNNYYQHDTREDYDAPPQHPSSKYPKMMNQSQYDRMPPHPMMTSHRHPSSQQMHNYYDSPYQQQQQQPPNFKFNNNLNQQMINNNNNNNNNMNRMNSIDNIPNTGFSLFETQPQLLSFKAFLQNLNQNLTPEQATKRYNEYKNNFRKEQIEIFFDTHKEEEWFKCRYHPDESVKRKEEYRAAIKRRLNIFMNLFENGYLDNVYVDLDNEDELKKFICAVIIKLEDGSDDDIKTCLSNEIIEIKNNDVEIINEKNTNDEDLVIEVKHSNSNNNINSDEDNADYDKDDIVELKKNDVKIDEKQDVSMVEENDKTTNNESDKESGMCSESDGTDSDGSTKSDSKKKRKKVKKQFKKNNNNNNDDINKNLNEKETNDKKNDEKNNNLKKFKQTIHMPKRVQSIFFKNLPVTTTRNDLEEIGKKFSGFKRVAISEPAPERGFQRRAWLTFDLDVDIRDVCSKINLMKLNGYSINASVNREIDEKIRTINSITNHKLVLRNDLKLISKIVSNMDKRWCLWDHEDTSDENNKKIKKNNVNGDNNKNNSEPSSAKEESSDDEEIKTPKKEIIKQKNPFLENVSEFIDDNDDENQKEIKNLEDNDKDNEEAEEEEEKSHEIKDEELIKFEKDTQIAKKLDRLVLYLRIVHSIDYYNITEYQQEDLMPNRLGILHARDKANLDKKLKKSEIDEYIKQFETNIKPYVDYKEKIDLEMARRLGLKDVNAEVDKFLNENCKELEKDKWLCPLSGKKFKAKEYVHKHILSKHSDKLDNIRKLCEFFNNFVYDPKRPYLPEHPLTKLNNSNMSSNEQMGQQQFHQLQQQQQQQQQHQQPPPYYQNRFNMQSQQPYYSNQSALLPSPGMHNNYQNRPNYYQQQNYPYRPPPQMQHNIRYKKF